MPTYAKLNDGRLMIVWSDNVDEETMSGYPAQLQHTWSAEFDICDEWDYSEILWTDTNPLGHQKSTGDIQ